MSFELDEYEVLGELTFMNGDVPSKNDFYKGDWYSLDEIGRLLFMDGDYYYEYAVLVDEYSYVSISVDVFAYGEELRVGELHFDFRVSGCGNKIVEYLEDRE